MWCRIDRIDNWNKSVRVNNHRYLELGSWRVRLSLGFRVYPFDHMSSMTYSKVKGRPMKAMLTAILAAGACLIVVENVKAQQNCAGSAGTAGAVGGPIITEGVGAAFSAQGNTLPYSYWVSAPNPSRIYVDYGSVDQFPFHGRPYGSPSDRWSWYNMGGGNSRYLARYYYPPLR
jgi:hypothetical protein